MLPEWLELDMDRDSRCEAAGEMGTKEEVGEVATEPGEGTAGAEGTVGEVDGEAETLAAGSDERRDDW